MRGLDMRPALVSLLLLSAPALAGSPPTRAALRKAFEANRPTVVEVVGPRRSGTGVLVGRSGQVLTSVEFVGLHAAKVRHGGAELSARVLLANAGLKVALVEIDAPGEYPAAAVRHTGAPDTGDWVVAITRSRKGELSPTLAQVARAPSRRSPFLEVDVPLPTGTPIFDAQGRLVALAVGEPARRTRRALPVPAVKVELASGPKP